jgi:hypothetical protein
VDPVVESREYALTYHIDLYLDLSVLSALLRSVPTSFTISGLPRPTSRSVHLISFLPPYPSKSSDHSLFRSSTFPRSLPSLPPRTLNILFFLRRSADASLFEETEVEGWSSRSESWMSSRGRSREGGRYIDGACIASMSPRMRVRYVVLFPFPFCHQGFRAERIWSARSLGFAEISSDADSCSVRVEPGSYQQSDRLPSPRVPRLVWSGCRGKLKSLLP